MPSGKLFHQRRQNFTNVIEHFRSFRKKTCRLFSGLCATSLKLCWKPECRCRQMFGAQKRFCPIYHKFAWKAFLQQTFTCKFSAIVGTFQFTLPKFP